MSLELNETVCELKWQLVKYDSFSCHISLLFTGHSLSVEERLTCTAALLNHGGDSEIVISETMSALELYHLFAFFPLDQLNSHRSKLIENAIECAAANNLRVDALQSSFP